MIRRLLFDRRTLLRISASASVSSLILAPEVADASNSVDPKTAAEQLLYCTVRIDGVLEGGTQKGTGFFFNIEKDKKAYPIIITNNHVVNGTKSISLRMHTVSGPSTSPDGNVLVSVPGGLSGLWTSHPNPKVDLCALPIGPIVNATHPMPFYKMISESIIPSEKQLTDLDAIEDIVMFGYPIGLADEENNYPILRRGVTATDPAIDFNGEPVTVVDMACFPGSSGSPVFIYNNGIYASRQGATVGARVMLLGVLYAGPQMKVDGTIESVDIPTSTRSFASMNIMINLGYIIKAREISALVSAITKRFNI